MLADECHRRLGRGRFVVEQGDGFDPGEEIQIGTGDREPGLVLIRCVGDQDRQRLAGRDVHLALDASHPEDDLPDPVDLGDGLGVVRARIGDGVGGEHDGLGIAASASAAVSGRPFARSPR
jgi:hypothetical protein